MKGRSGMDSCFGLFDLEIQSSHKSSNNVI